MLKNHTKNKLNNLVENNKLKLNLTTLIFNFLKNDNTFWKIYLNRNNIINFFFTLKFVIIPNGKFLKKIFLFNYFLGLKAGELIFTRSKFIFLKKNKKVIKR